VPLPSFEGSCNRERRPHWPTGTVTARFHRCSKTPTRPQLRAAFAGALGPHALLRLLQMYTSTSTTTDHSNIPNHRICGWDDCRAGLKVAFQSRTTAGGTQGQGSKKPNLDAPQRDCSRQGLRPNLARSGCLMSRALLFALSGETRGRERCHRVVPACTASATQRVVRRPVSAKKPDAHQPEAPSVIGPSRETEAHFLRQRKPPGSGQHLFHRPQFARGTLVRIEDGSALD